MAEEGAPDNAQIPPPPAEGGGGSSHAEAEAASLAAGLSPEELEAQAAPKIEALPAAERAAATSSATEAAIAEEKSLSSYLTPEQLAQRAAHKEDDRTQRFRDAFEQVAIGTLWVGGITILVLAVIWALHLVLPANKRWLTAEDLTHIQTLLTAGVLVGAVSSHFKKRLGDLGAPRS